MRARPVRIVTERGKSLAVVPLSRSGENDAVLEQQDYEMLIAAGVSPNWHTVGGSVTAHTPKGQRLIGRILMGAEAGEQVRYLDGNTLNLRRSNMTLKIGGFSINNDAEIMA